MLICLKESPFVYLQFLISVDEPVLRPLGD